ncbi:hypothetical protein RRG08_062002 [Elysia crispata]|uniref:Uncharacterized protein n=1 Tax=Elysia crispata TaxID=231223 RepID=A0AAE1A484_9GAST|nr:hypothetical protein RRG08_062002 [Elysia crispata]
MVEHADVQTAGQNECRAKPDLTKMKVAVTATLMLLVTQCIADQVCQSPQSESVFYLTSSLSDFYVANDFEQGRILLVFSNNSEGDHWTYLDLNNQITYYNVPEKGCKFEHYLDEENELFQQCLPDDAKLERSGDVDFYAMEREGFTWLVGMQPVPDTNYYFRHFSRFFYDGVVAEENTYGIVYKYSVGLSDPTVFDKDLSACVEGPLGS